MTLLTLRTQRLVLRAPVPQDAAVIASALNNLNISRWLAVVPYPYTQEDADWFIAEVSAGRLRARLIWQGDQFIGAIGIDDSLGYWLAEHAWGRGYATEAAKAVLTDFFADPEQIAITASHMTANTPSAHLLHRLGFIGVGQIPITCAATGRTEQGRRMRLTRERWESLNA
ncbi:GNAT family N-acetyltransferase [Yoonia sediminilitoris]|uniref:RimJ/RimL family protein N-acetyltransferase n=1 Tax=Yoonia sediminilitoris TaxID=1286148 RepID=A0A2T6KCK4_9RHOB|nr:GNAT family N-acetyltransferase [Yoonia sediminilitoris]PUB12701.1 RimJ/RimL family protein N-acetyltransferase [Yoonia sediminilitoris]RCW94180.1 RimJ/RimL family protein N-acetyltransferase [Yoonia sediminilitoris]